MSEANGIDRVWRYKPIAQSLGISTKTLQRLVARGEIATVHITDRIRGITESERARFIASRITGGA
jgi:predicted site-specific integrase-resolvase